MIKRFWLIGAALIAVGIASGFSAQASALINDRIELEDKSIGIAISPMSSQRLDLKPGSAYEGSFRLRQTGRETNEVVAEVTPFSAGAVDYDSSDFAKSSDRTKITEWIALGLSDCDITSREGNKIYFAMRPQEECFVDYRVSVPSDATGGSQRAGIFIQSVATNSVQSGTGVSNSYRIGYIITSDVDGPNAKRAGKVVENNIPGFLFWPPITVNSKVANTGNIDFDAKYTVKMKSIFSGITAFKDETTRTIFADTVRSGDVTWKDAPFLGIFKVTQTVEILGETFTTTKTVVILPIFVIVIVLILIALLIVRNVAKKNRENSKHGNMQIKS